MAKNYLVPQNPEYNIFERVAADWGGMHSNEMNALKKYAWQFFEKYGKDAPPGIYERMRNSEQDFERDVASRRGNFMFPIPQRPINANTSAYAVAQQNAAQDQALVNQNKAPANDPGLLRFYLMQKALAGGQ